MSEQFSPLVAIAQNPGKIRDDALVDFCGKLLHHFLVNCHIFDFVVAALEEEHMACLDQQHFGREGQAAVVVEDLSISDLDDSSNLDCICCLKDHNYYAVVGFAAE